MKRNRTSVMHLHIFNYLSNGEHDLGKTRKSQFVPRRSCFSPDKAPRPQWTGLPLTSLCSTLYTGPKTNAGGIAGTGFARQNAPSWKYENTSRILAIKYNNLQADRHQIETSISIFMAIAASETCLECYTTTVDMPTENTVALALPSCRSMPAAK